jgi:hypothetical protein
MRFAREKSARSRGPIGFPAPSIPGLQVDSTEARKAEELRGTHSMPLGGTFEVVKLFIGGIADDT